MLIVNLQKVKTKGMYSFLLFACEVVAVLSPSSILIFYIFCCRLPLVWAYDCTRLIALYSTMPVCRHCSIFISLIEMLRRINKINIKKYIMLLCLCNFDIFKTLKQLRIVHSVLLYVLYNWLPGWILAQCKRRVHGSYMCRSYCFLLTYCLVILGEIGKQACSIIFSVFILHMHGACIGHTIVSNLINLFCLVLILNISCLQKFIINGTYFNSTIIF